MREARLILPDHPFTAYAIAVARRELAREFGGYTETMGWGTDALTAGVRQTEPVRIWDVAVDPLPTTTVPVLRALAARLCRLGEQRLVYLRLPDGSVELVEPEPEHMAVGHA